MIMFQQGLTTQLQVFNSSSILSLVHRKVVKLLTQRKGEVLLVDVDELDKIRGIMKYLKGENELEE
jgi:trehalose-6-phosphate synthase